MFYRFCHGCISLDILWMMPCNSIPLQNLRWFSNALRLAILTESRRLEMRLLCCCGCIDCLAGCVVLVAGSPVRSQCRFPGLQAFFQVCWKVDQNPFRICLFWAVLNGWTLLISWFWEGIQYDPVRKIWSEQQLFALGVGDTGEDASPNDGPRQEQCGVWSLLC